MFPLGFQRNSCCDRKLFIILRINQVIRCAARDRNVQFPVDYEIFRFLRYTASRKVLQEQTERRGVGLCFVASPLDRLLSSTHPLDRCGLQFSFSIPGRLAPRRAESQPQISFSGNWSRAARTREDPAVYPCERTLESRFRALPRGLDEFLYTFTIALYSAEATI